MRTHIASKRTFYWNCMDCSLQERFQHLYEKSRFWLEEEEVWIVMLGGAEGMNLGATVFVCAHTICVCMCMSIYTFTHTHVHTCMYVCIFVCVYLYIYIYIYIYIYASR
jgi:hypothetical protein